MRKRTGGKSGLSQIKLSDCPLCQWWWLHELLCSLALCEPPNLQGWRCNTASTRTAAWKSRQMLKFFQSWNHKYEINELRLSKRYNATTFIEFTNVWKMLQALVVKEQFPRRTMTMLISRTSRHQETSWDMKLLSCLLRPIKIRNFGHLDDFSVFCFGLLYLFVLFAPDLNHWKWTGLVVATVTSFHQAWRRNIIVFLAKRGTDSIAKMQKMQEAVKYSIFIDICGVQSYTQHKYTHPVLTCIIDGYWWINGLEAGENLGGLFCPPDIAKHSAEGVERSRSVSLYTTNPRVRNHDHAFWISFLQIASIYWTHLNTYCTTHRTTSFLHLIIHDYYQLLLLLYVL